MAYGTRFLELLQRTRRKMTKKDSDHETPHQTMSMSTCMRSKEANDESPIPRICDRAPRRADVLALPRVLTIPLAPDQNEDDDRGRRITGGRSLAHANEVAVAQRRRRVGGSGDGAPARVRLNLFGQFEVFTSRTGRLLDFLHAMPPAHRHAATLIIPVPGVVLREAT